jgi:cysteinyl-tRNA synthetase
MMICSTLSVNIDALRDKKGWALTDLIRERIKESNIILEDAKEIGGKYTLKW